jgi:hypothetical protein
MDIQFRAFLEDWAFFAEFCLGTLSFGMHKLHASQIRDEIRSEIGAWAA